MGKIKVPYKPRYPDVHEALETHRFIVLVAHRRFGKTVLSVNHLLKQALLCEKERGMYAYVGPLRNQAKATAWDYLKKYSAPVPGRKVNEGELSIVLLNGAVVRVFGADNPDALRGLYFDGIILDEVAQMKSEVWSEIIQPALADRMGWAVFIGTPKGVNLFSELYETAAERSAHGDPNWLALSFPVTKTNALPEAEVDRLRKEQSDNVFRQEMLCDFTASCDNVLITIDEATQAMETSVDIETMRAWPIVIGVDVARFGGDSTVFFARRGLYAYQPVVLNHMSNTDVAHRLMAYIAELSPSYVCIDQGQGTGVIDLVRDLTTTSSVRIVEIPFGSQALKPDLYANRRAEMWVSIRDWIRGGGHLPNILALKAELTAPTYEYDAKGRIKLEAKEDIKERLNGRSTDLADALGLTFAVRVFPDRNSVFPEWDEHYGSKAASKLRDRVFGEDSEPWDPFKGQESYEYQWR